MDISGIDSFARWLGLGAGAGGGFMFIKWLIETFISRVDKREARIEAGNAAVIKTLSDRVEALTTRLNHVESELIKCQEAHARVDAERMRYEALFEGMGMARQEASRIVAVDRIEEALTKEGKKS